MSDGDGEELDIEITVPCWIVRRGMVRPSDSGRRVLHAWTPGWYPELTLTFYANNEAVSTPAPRVRSTKLLCFALPIRAVSDRIQTSLAPKDAACHTSSSELLVTWTTARPR